jgi:hypothetical protein
VTCALPALIDLQAELLMDAVAAACRVNIGNSSFAAETERRGHTGPARLKNRQKQDDT